MTQVKTNRDWTDIGMRVLVLCFGHTEDKMELEARADLAKLIGAFLKTEIMGAEDDNRDTKQQRASLVESRASARVQDRAEDAENSCRPALAKRR